MIGNRPVEILRAPETSARDAEGRRVASAPVVVATVAGNMFDRQMTYSDEDGQLITVLDGRALLPPGTDLRSQDLLRAGGVVWRVNSVTRRYNHLGQEHHVSAQCVREDREDG